MASNPPYLDITTCTACFVCSLAPGSPKATWRTGCRGPFHCVGPGTHGRCHPYLTTVRPLSPLFDSLLFDDKKSTHPILENLPQPLQSFVDHTAAFAPAVERAPSPGRALPSVEWPGKPVLLEPSMTGSPGGPPPRTRPPRPRERYKPAHTSQILHQGLHLPAFWQRKGCLCIM